MKIFERLVEQATRVKMSSRYIYSIYRYMHTSQYKLPVFLYFISSLAAHHTLHTMTGSLKQRPSITEKTSLPSFTRSIRTNRTNHGAINGLQPLRWTRWHAEEGTPVFLRPHCKNCRLIFYCTTTFSFANLEI